MTGWLLLTEQQRKTAIEQAQVLSKIITSTKPIEKDWWVTLVLKALFQSAYADHLVFKGGTSLSKGYKLINRFSEDIDLALSSEAFGMQYSPSPTTSYISRLRRKGFNFTTTTLLDELKNQLLQLGVPEDKFTLDFDSSPENQTPADPVTIYVKYKSLFDASEYIADQVKIEISVRSLSTPFTSKKILSLLSEFFPNDAYPETSFDLHIVEPRKTFLEKAFLLHEEFSKEDKTKIRTERMSRHLYDLVAMMQSDVLNEALVDHDLYDSLIAHRKKYNNVSWANYDTLHPSTISFIPPDEVLPEYEKDYEVMRSEMIYGDTLDFKNIVEALKLLQEKFRQKLDVK